MGLPADTCGEFFISSHLEMHRRCSDGCLVTNHNNSSVRTPFCRSCAWSLASPCWQSHFCAHTAEPIGASRPTHSSGELRRKVTARAPPANSIFQNTFSPLESTASVTQTVSLLNCSLWKGFRDVTDLKPLRGASSYKPLRSQRDLPTKEKNHKLLKSQSALANTASFHTLQVRDKF